ncbi:hypothetical protein [Methylobacterium sp. R2-1]|uniref:hypothetical protein n=1 Tax=Methylobacterium sp. R2-1 TaxID=2587064 RepID=UPI001614BC4A|nr:hypothetical protein [Methylobacterium sp. R2-1]MBB2959832.1 hypothetical protein [Methylobacterium sp. R2-1]
MIRSMRLALALAIATLGPAVSPASAQTFTLPELGLQNGGACPDLAVRERTGKTMVSVGCVDGTAKTIRWKGEGSGINVTPTTSAASGTLARLMADRAPLASPVFSGSVKTTLPAGCIDSTAGKWTGDYTSTWIPDCFGTWQAGSSGAIPIFATRGTTSSNHTYPPDPGAGTPFTRGGAYQLVNGRADGGVQQQVSGSFINMDVVGGSVSEAHPSDELSPNATGMLISGHQHPGPNGERPPTYWGLNIDTVIGSGSKQVQTYGIEMDHSNFNGECIVGGQPPAGQSFNCTSAWFFYGGINPYPNLAFHYFGNPITYPYSGTVTTSGNTFTFVSGTGGRTKFDHKINRIDYGGQRYRVDCTDGSTCTADRPIGNNSTPGAWAGTSSMAHYGLFFQDNDNGSQVQDADFLMNDSARAIVQATGNHKVGLDFTADAMPFAAYFKSGQAVCYNGTFMCMSQSSALKAWMFHTGPDQSSAVARIDANGNLSMNGTLTANGNVSTGAYFASGVAGVSCNGPPTQQFQVVGGIVTRC